MDEIKDYINKWNQDGPLNLDSTTYLNEAIVLLVKKVEELEQEIKNISKK